MQTFEHQAMATRFTLQISGEEEDYARTAAKKCFEKIDELEQKLSRFLPDSDISRINRMKEEDELIVDLETWAILKEAIRIGGLSRNTFDIGVAEMMDIFRAGKEGILTPREIQPALEQAFREKQQGSLFIDPDDPRVYCIREGIKLDLGGIGKGFALDRLHDIMDEYEIGAYALNAGDSTIAVRTENERSQPWTYTLSSAEENRKISLRNDSVSASGTHWQGNHIFDPRTGKNTLRFYDRVWVCCELAIHSDAFSTAFFLLSEKEIEDVISASDEIKWTAVVKDEKLHFLSSNEPAFVL